MKKAFSLIELLVVVAIIAILVIAAFATLTSDRDKASDATVKSDMQKMKIAFEDYYNDNNCYPPAAWFSSAADCNSGNLRPYMNAIPCDPHTGLPYKIITDATGCGWYRLYAKLQNPSDGSAIPGACSIDGSTYQYGVGSDNTLVTACTTGGNGYAPSPTPSPSLGPQPSQTPNPSFTPAPSGGTQLYYYCSGLDNCTQYDPTVNSCSPSYVNNPFCDGKHCSSIGSCTRL